MHIILHLQQANYFCQSAGNGFYRKTKLILAKLTAAFYNFIKLFI